MKLPLQEFTLFSLDKIKNLTSDFFQDSTITILFPLTLLSINPLNQTVTSLLTNFFSVTQIVLSAETRKAIDHVVCKFMKFDPTLTISEPAILQFIVHLSSTYAPTTLQFIYSLLKKYIL